MLNLKPDEFWGLSWPEFWLLYEGWQVRHQYAHEHTRYLAAMMVNTSMGAPKQALQPKNLYPLPEIDGEPKKTSAAEIEAFRQRISQRLGREVTFMKAINE